MDAFLHNLFSKKQLSRSHRRCGLPLLAVAVALLGQLFFSTAARAQTAEPVLRLTPNAGQAGSLVILEGAGFDPDGGSLTVFWNDEKIGQFVYPPGNGNFRQPFLVPAQTPIGKHSIRICQGICATPNPASSAEATFQAQAAQPAYSGKVAYIFLKDRATGQQFQQLLGAHGFSVELISVADAAGTDFTQFELVLVGPDTGRDEFWGDNNPETVEQIGKNPKIVGIGSGGHAFFGMQKQPIGYPNGLRGVASAAAPSDPGQTPDRSVFFRSPYDFSALPQQAFPLLQKEAPFVAVLPFQRAPQLMPLLHPAPEGDPITDAAVITAGCALLWGFDASPELMTPLGQALFVNAVAFALGNPCSAPLGNACQVLLTPEQIPAATAISFDDLPDGQDIGDHYAQALGVRFEISGTTKALTYSDRPSDVGKARSAPNAAINSAIFPNTSSGVPMRIAFDQPQSHAGMWIGNGKGAAGTGPDIPATLTALDANGRILCRASRGPVQASHEDFIGLYDAFGRIRSLELTYGDSVLSESIDDLTFGPYAPTDRIRVCRKGRDGGCLPVAGAQVHHIRPNAPTGWVLSTGPDGYLQERGRVRFGDGLWPTVAVSATDTYTLLHTAANPYPVNPARFAGTPAGEMQLFVDATSPLLVFDVQVSTQWSLLTDGPYIKSLVENIQKAANYLYDFSDGQVILGRVNIYQNYDQWDESDVWIFSSNNLRPQATIGGVVQAPTPDPLLGADQSYYPGHVLMGRTWNRFGEPGIPPHLAPQVQDDWPLALAHEFGHYLLFLYDTYLTLTDEGEKEIRSCTGSAMGWVYDSGNTEFVGDEAHWQKYCGITLANQILKRTEWATIRLWYQALLTPPAVNPGPAMAPVPLTQIFVHPPSNPAVLLEDQSFKLNYQNGETASGEARAFIFRNGRVLDQGKPFPESTEIELSGAQTNDRFCLFDVNDYTDDDTEEPRHQFGCETLAVGDNTLQMEADASWAPVIEIRHFTSATVGISVTQQITPGSLKARLYPEHSAQSTEISLTSRPDGSQHFGLFNSPVEATAAFVELWVEEPATEENPRRATVVDFGTGGSGVHGPTSMFGGVPIVSSDGKAEYARQTNIFLEDGQFIALQSMAGTPRPPADRRVIGQAYRLVALPEPLANEGHVALRIRPPRPAQPTRAAGQTLPDATVYFWNGKEWTALETVNVDDLTDGRVALAPSQGVGLYALLLETADPTEQRIYLPQLSR